MPSKRFMVVEALRQLVAAAVPTTDVRGLPGDDGKPRRLEPEGMIEVGSGDVGEPTVDLSPPTWWWDHAIPVQLAAYGADERTAKLALDAMLLAIGARIDADPSLGGLCQRVEAGGASDGEIEQQGARTICWADVTVLASYPTTSPLG